MHDTINPPITDWCAVDKMPAEYCDMHCVVEGCSASNEIAGPYCPSSMRYGKCILLFPPDSIFARLRDYEETVANAELAEGEEPLVLLADFAKIFPNAIITALGPDQYLSYALRNGKVCQVHGHGATPVTDDLEAIRSRAAALISQVNSYLANVQTLPETDRATLDGLIAALREAMSGTDVDVIKTALDQLKTSYEYLSAMYPLPVVSETEPPAEETPAPSSIPVSRP